MADNLGYEHASISTSTSRSFHAFTAEATGNIKDSYKNLKGDSLKTAILADFMESLQNVPLGEVKQKIAEFKDSDEYKILKKSQGRFTRFFSLKTDSEKAFDNICEKAEAGAFVGRGEVEQPDEPRKALGI